jgi:hypothetical protein
MQTKNFSHSSSQFDHWIMFLCALILCVHAALLAISIKRNFVTVDEYAHVPAGLSHWQTGSYILYRVNPPLARMLAVIPLLLAKPKTDYGLITDRPGFRLDWAVGRQFMIQNAPRYFSLICYARFFGIIWSIIGAMTIFVWARQLYGPVAGLLGLIMWCFSPNILAYAPLVVPDIPATVCGLLACYWFWRYLMKPNWSVAFIAGMFLGIAQLTKFTMLILYLLFPVLLGIWLAFQPRVGPVRVIERMLQLLAIGIVSIMMINMGYSFDGSFRRLGNYLFISKTLAGTVHPSSDPVGNRFRDSWLGILPVPLPSQYVQGIDQQKADFEAGLFSYLRGHWRQRGWYHYYLYALAIKVPLGIWVLVIWNLILAFFSRYGTWFIRDDCMLWLPVLAILIFVSSQTGFNHHVRYVFPIIPFVIISTCRLAVFFQPSWSKAALLVSACLSWAVGSSLWYFPHSLSYFNELVGGPDKGHNHLVNSNIDWGQDLLELKDWLQKHPEARPLGLAYFNLVDPGVVDGLDFYVPPLGPTGTGLERNSTSGATGPISGYFAVSVNFVRGMGFSCPDGTGGQFGIPLHGYEYFQYFQPIAKAGYSIFIYHITLEQANAVRRQFGLPLLTPQSLPKEP